MLSPKDAWHATLGQLQLQLNRATFDTWLKGSEVVAYEDGEFTIRVRHAYAKDWLEKHLGQVVPQALSSIFGRAVKVNYMVNIPMRPLAELDATPAGPLFSTPAAVPAAAPASADALTGAATSAEPAAPTPASAANQDVAPAQSIGTPGTESPAAVAPQAEVSQAAAPQAAAPQAAAAQPSAPVEMPDISEWDPRFRDLPRSTPRPQSGPVAASTSFDRRYTFSSFITGPSNQFACAAAQAVAQAPGTTYNPLVFYGGTGLGKTHLMHAIGHVCEAAGKRVVYVTAEQFTNEMVAAIRDHTTEQLRERYRSADVLMVDDIQFLAGKTSSEEEFFHTFNAIFARKGQLVVACNQHPRALTKLDDRLRSRLEGGLLADVQPPVEETRQAILKSKSAAQGTPLPDEVAALLAKQATQSVRELEGLLTQILARATLTGQPLTVALAQNVLTKTTNTLAPLMQQTPDLDRIFKTTATYHQLSLDDLLSKKRTKDVVRARQIAMYLAREITEASYPEIGKARGGRNHSTVLYGFQKIAEQIESDEELRREMGDIRRQIYLFSKD